MVAGISFRSAVCSDTEIARADLDEIFHLRYGEESTLGPVPRLWLWFGYFPPDVFYEATVAQLVHQGTFWVDAGCGRDLFPDNPVLAQRLAARCGLLVGVDPDENLAANPFVHERVQSPIEDFQSEDTFTLVTLRMVAEHLVNPEKTIAALAGLTQPGGKVVVFTVNRWSPVSFWSGILPFGLHHPIKRLLWRTEERDTFPVAYRMNTRKQLAQLFEAQGFRESSFRYLDDCRTFFRFRWLHVVELALWRFVRAFGRSYPENCLLGVYERTDQGVPPRQRQATLPWLSSGYSKRSTEKIV
jgi:SAM-dependent methyltransferase